MTSSVNLLKYYTQTESTPWLNKGLCFLFGLLAVFLLSFLYGVFSAVNPIIYLAIVLPVLLGIGVGMCHVVISKITKVRDIKFILISGLVLGVFAVYFSWGAYFIFNVSDGEYLWYNYFSSLGLILYPEELLSFIKYAYNNGLWELMGDIPVNKLPLALCWIGEAGIILSLIWKQINAYSPVPFDNRGNSWFKKYRLFDEYQSIPNESFFFDIEGSTITQKIGNLRKGNSTRYGRISIYYLTDSSECYFNYENVNRDRKGKRENAEVIIDNVKISNSEAKLLIKTNHARKQSFLDY